ncbi:efflux RND transporter periplasmic adaptor subunit [Bradyrhizobium tropiciagri]|uniref:efflux RND transporter periplasmic adaptor subunit n=1 Tax=Bradyrhizobium tropiciagri TaxID=312253 RepID=UPI001BA6D5BE|nr:efflux RND transporter periplasmic adaptor subunit [Bradyrhizobium tropiciagri]MBR0897682.1 efflux RND transporter periplasmic adaptor subunit [Bradyrhizobium tropiciagri]
MTTASPIYSFAEDASRAESVAWAKFSAAKDSAEFCTSWLAILCMQVERAGGGLLLLGPDKDGAYVPAAVWPHPGLDMQHLSPAAERALTERRGIVALTEGRGAFIGYPIEVSGTLHGVVVLDIGPGPEAALQRALRLLHWASAWLIDQFRKGALEEREARLTRMGIAMDIVATAMQERHLSASALAVANELAGRLACDRVSIGLEKSGSTEVKVISHTATFDPKMDLGRRIGNAMDEVLDLDVALVFPPRDDVERAALAHDELAREYHDVAICSVPLVDGGHATGVLTLERTRGEPFDDATIELCKTVGGLLGPILTLKRESERNLLQYAGSSVRHGAEVLFGPRHPGAKLIALLALGFILFFSIVNGTYRVAAKTVIEGAVQRIAAAPFDGFIAESFVRAGDTVKVGQVLCKLDDRELKLEQARLSSEREQLERKYRQALAAQERSTMAILQAQIDQVDAMLSLTKDKLSRATLVAPFDGIVVAGDLQQLLGTPVELGKSLFTIAPLDSYRVILQVEERDISYLKLKQQGELTLSGIPHQQMEFSVEQITPVSTAQDGRNFFRVEARMRDASEQVRPGMEGVGKVEVGERKLIWIWTHYLVDWVRLTIWKWLF